MKRILLLPVTVAAIFAICSLTANATGPSRAVTLRTDTGQSRAVAASWQAGDEAGVMFAADADQFPLVVTAVSCRLAILDTEPPAAPETKLTLQARLYSGDGQAPGALLASSPVGQADLTAGQTWFTCTLDVPLFITDTTPLMATIAYHSGISGTAPSLVTDNQFDLPDGRCFYRHRDGPWLPHAEQWRDPANTGQVMIRVHGFASIPTSYRTTEALVADRDTYFTQGQPALGNPALAYVQAGNGPAGVIGAVRTMMAFAALEPPTPGATIGSATLMLASYRALLESVDARIDVYAAERAWQEDAACWNTDADNAGALLATRYIAGRERLESELVDGQKLNGWLTFDLTELAQAWLADPASNHGVQLRGDEATANSAQFCQSREYEHLPAYRPQLLVEWTWPDPDFTRRAMVPLITR